MTDDYQVGFVYRRDDGQWGVGVEHDKPPRKFTHDLQEADFTLAPMYRGAFFVWGTNFGIDFGFGEPGEPPVDLQRDRLEVVLATRDRKTGKVAVAT